MNNEDNPYDLLLSKAGCISIHLPLVVSTKEKIHLTLTINLLQSKAESLSIFALTCFLERDECGVCLTRMSRNLHVNFIQLSAFTFVSVRILT
jgi:hypothetical protein